MAVLNGNELIVRGGLEAGFSLYTGYPGSPIADYFSILHKKRKELRAKGVRVAIANNEANAAAMASGAKQAGRDSLVAMKSMGLQVAGDALSVGNFATPEGEARKRGDSPAVVLVVGDDPWSLSTSAPVDSRYLFKHLHIPFLEPSTPQELKDWVGLARLISKKTSLYQGLLLTTFMAEGGGRVKMAPVSSAPSMKSQLDPKLFNLSESVMVPPNSLWADERMIKERFPLVLKAYGELGLDKCFGHLGSKVGFISSGFIFESLKQILEEEALLGDVSLYKVASSFPLGRDSLMAYLKGLTHLIVVEEKRGFLEAELTELIGRGGLSICIHGKRFGQKEGFPSHGGLSYEIIRKKLGEVLPSVGLLGPRSRATGALRPMASLPRRFPTFCPGCPHRETLSVLKDLRRKLEAQGVALISHGDVGCYSLSFLPPFREMHNLSAMGQGGALGAGCDLFSGNPSVVLMGDSTFFHSGITDISNSVQLGHNITYILLDNDNTAMTGHQMTPVSGVSVEGDVRPRQSILTTVKALGVAKALEVHPSDRYFYQNLLMDMVGEKGVKVIVSRKECALTFHGRKKAKEKNVLAQGVLKEKTFYQINTLTCEDCRVCVEETGCPGLSLAHDAYGTKISIDPQICVADSYCTKIKACPSFERVLVTDYHPTRYREDILHSDTEHLPSPRPKITLDAISRGRDFRAVITGVGGSGVTTLSRLMAKASEGMEGRDDIDFKFVEQKGLAQRNGNVTGHLALYQKGKSYGAITPEGTADLYLSPDLLDGAFHIQFLSAGGEALVDTTYQPPLSLLLNGGSDVGEEDILADFRGRLGDRFKAYPFKSFSHRAFGKSVYASSMILGAAFQRGTLPFGEKALHGAFESCFTGEELTCNLRAFQLGRKMILEGREWVENILGPSSGEVSLDIYLQSIKEGLLPWQKATFLLRMFERGLKRLRRYLEDIPEGHLMRYLHDIYIYDRGSKAEDFIQKAAGLVHLYEDREERALALRVLAKTYFIKDEIFVSHIMLSPLKREMDERAFASLGRCYRVRPINRPSFDLWGKKLEFDLNPRRWMLRIMRHARLLRLLLRSWHAREREIAVKIRHEILHVVPKQTERGDRLRKLDNIKGFRQVRYRKAQDVFSAA